jgi:hypothetical protein
MQRRFWLFLIVALGWSTHSVAWRFDRPVYYTVGYRVAPLQITTADFNNDGNVDLATADYLNSKVSILLGNGDGTFQKPLKFSAPAPVALAGGHFGKGSTLDLLVVESGGTGHGTLGLYSGKGDGTFRKSGTYPLGIESNGVAVGDFNGDGRDDVAVVNKGAGDKTGSLMLFFGKGDGTLGKSKIYKLPGTPLSITTGDLNGDGYLDIVVAKYSGQSVAVFLNDGKGNFGNPADYPTVGPSAADNAVIADLNHDGIPDLVVACPGGIPGVNVFLGKGDGTFGIPSLYTAYYAPYGASALVVADFNLDGNLDIVSVINGDNEWSNPTLFYGNGDGTFRSGIEVKTGNTGSVSSVTADFDNNGALDLAVALLYKGKVAVLLNAKPSSH